MFCLCPNNSVSSKNSEEIKEKVDDIKVKVKSSKDILLRADGIFMISPNHDLSIIDDVEGENDSTSSRIANLGISTS